MEILIKYAIGVQSRQKVTCSRQWRN